MLTACALFLANTASADDVFQSVNRQLTASVGGHYLNYKEKNAQFDPLDKETGTQVAFQGKASIQGDLYGIHDIYLSTTLDYAIGHTNYDGYLIAGPNRYTPYQANTHNNLLDVSLKAGKALRINPVAQVIPYVFYEHRFWNRDSSADPHGYDEHYNHNSVGIGALGQYAITPKLVASLDAGVGRTFASTMTASNVSGTFHLGSGTIVNGTVGLDYALTRHLHINAAYKVTHFRYGKSDTVSQIYYEPDSTTTEQTFLLGMGYAF